MMILVITIIVLLALDGSLFTVFATLSSNMQSIPSSNNNVDVLLDRASMAELFDIGSGIFALILCALSLRAYRNLKSTRMLFVSAAFGMFAVHAIASRLDVLIPAIESSVLELIVSIISFVTLAFFFLAIVTKSKMKAKTRTPPPTS
jgi:hypothetical protein